MGQGRTVAMTLSGVSFYLFLLFVTLQFVGRTSCGDEFDLRLISLFAADRFAPRDFDGTSLEAANDAVKRFFQISQKEIARLDPLYDANVHAKIMSSLENVCNSVDLMHDRLSNLKVFKETDDFIRTFGDPRASVFCEAGFTKHAMKCEFFKYKKGSKKYYRILIFNTGDGIGTYHHCRRVENNIHYCPVLIFDCPEEMINSNWIKVFVEIMEMGQKRVGGSSETYETTAQTFYGVLFGDMIPSGQKFPDFFVPPQLSGTCTMSSYHAYFQFKLGVQTYNRIHAIVTARILQEYLASGNSDFISEGQRNALCLRSPSSFAVDFKKQEKQDMEYFQNAGKDHPVAPSYKVSMRGGLPETPTNMFMVQRWNISFTEWIIRQLGKLAVDTYQNLPVAKPAKPVDTCRAELLDHILRIYGAFQLKRRSHESRQKISSLSGKKPLQWIFPFAEFCAPNHEIRKEDMSGLTGSFCVLPQIHDSVEETLKSVEGFFESEKKFSRCFNDNEGLLIPFFTFFTQKLMSRLESCPPGSIHSTAVMELLTSYFFNLTSILSPIERGDLVHEKGIFLQKIIKFFETYLSHYLVSKYPLEKQGIIAELFSKIRSSFACLGWEQACDPKLCGTSTIDTSFPGARGGGMYVTNLYDKNPIIFYPKCGALDEYIQENIDQIFDLLEDPILFQNLSVIKSVSGDILDDDFINEMATAKRISCATAKKLIYCACVLGNLYNDGIMKTLSQGNSSAGKMCRFVDPFYVQYCQMIDRLFDKKKDSRLIDVYKDKIRLNYRKLFDELSSSFYQRTENEAVVKRFGFSSYLGFLCIQRPISSVLILLMRIQENSLYLLRGDSLYYLYYFVIDPHIPYAHSGVFRTVFRFFFWKKKLLLHKLHGIKFKNTAEPPGVVRLLITYQVTLNHLYRMNPKPEFSEGICGYEIFFQNNPHWRPFFCFLKVHYALTHGVPPDVEDYLNFATIVPSLLSTLRPFEINYTLATYFRVSYDGYLAKNEEKQGNTTKSLISGCVLEGSALCEPRYVGPTYGSDFLSYLGSCDKLDHMVYTHWYSWSGGCHRGITYNQLQFVVSDENLRSPSIYYLSDDASSNESRFLGRLVNQDELELEKGLTISPSFFGSNAKLFYVQMTQNRLLVFNTNGNIYGLLTGSEFRVWHKRTSFLPLSSGVLSIKEFRSSVQSPTIDEALVDRGALFNFSMDTSIYRLDEQNETSYFIFQKFRRPSRKCFVIEKTVGNRLETTLRLDGIDHSIVSPKDLTCPFAGLNLPVLFLMLNGKRLIAVNHPFGESEVKYYDDWQFDVTILECDETFTPVTTTAMHNLLLSYWMIRCKFYNEAMNYAVNINGGTRAFDRSELFLIRLILDVGHRDIEALVFQGYFFNIFQDNCQNFIENVAESLGRSAYIRSLSYVHDLIPAKYSQISRTFLPKFEDSKQVIAYASFLGRLEMIQETTQVQGKSTMANVDGSCLENFLSHHNDTNPTSIKPVASVIFKAEWNVEPYFYRNIKDKSDGEIKEFIIQQYLDYFRFYASNYQVHAFAGYEYFHILYAILTQIVVDNDDKLAEFCRALKNETKDHLSGLYSECKKPPSATSTTGIAANVEELLGLLDANKESSLFLDEVPLAKPDSTPSSLRSLIAPIDGLDVGKSIFEYTRNILLDDSVLVNVLLSFDRSRLGEFFRCSEENHAKVLNQLWRHFYSERYLKGKDSEQHKRSCQCKQSEHKDDYDDAALKTLTESDKIFVVVEHFSNYCLKTSQKDALKEIFQSVRKGTSIVYQKIMGGGKTSVFGTCLALYSTHVLKKIPIFVFPQNLVEQNASYMENRLWSLFKKKLFRIRMHRTKHNYSPTYLRYVMYNLVIHCINREAVICSPEAIQCLQNARKELLKNYFTVAGDPTLASRRDEYMNACRLVLEILFIIKTRAMLVVDEIDTVMNLTKTVNFNSTEVEQHDRSLVAFFVDAYSRLREKKASIPKLNFREKLLPSDEAAVKDGIRSLLPDRPEHVDFFLENGMITSLRNIKNVNYGLPHKGDIPYVVPYSSSNTPTTSFFGSYWYTLALSLKYYLEEELAERPVFLDDFVIHDILDIFKVGSELRTGDLFVLFKKCIYHDEKRASYFGQFFENFVLPKIVTYAHQFVCNPYEFISSATLFVGYSGTIYDKKVLKRISSDATNDATSDATSDATNGATNDATNGVTVNTDEGLEIEHKILSSFADDSSYPVVKSFSQKSDNDLLSELLDFAATDHECSALFDAGALLRNFKNEAVADSLLLTKGYDCVFYFDDQLKTLHYKISDALRRSTNAASSKFVAPHSKQFEEVMNRFNPKSAPNVPASAGQRLEQKRMFLYLDESHTVGVDVDLNNLSAKCVITVSSILDKKGFYQALLRARKLLNGITFDRKAGMARINPLVLHRQTVKIFHTELIQYTSMFDKGLKDQMEVFGKYEARASSLKPILLSCAINQIIKDEKELSLMAPYRFYSHLTELFFMPDSRAGAPKWQKIFKLDRSRFADHLWIFYYEAPSVNRTKVTLQKFFDNEWRDGATPVFSADAVGKIPEQSSAASLSDGTAEVEREQMVEISIETESKSMMYMECPNPAQQDSSNLNLFTEHSISDYKIRATRDFVISKTGGADLESCYNKPLLFVLRVEDKLAAISASQAERILRNEMLADEFGKITGVRTPEIPNYEVICPHIVGYQDISTVDFTQLVHYFAYSGSYSGLYEAVDPDTLAHVLSYLVPSKNVSLDKWKTKSCAWNYTLSRRFLQDLINTVVPAALDGGEIQCSLKVDNCEIAMELTVPSGSGSKTNKFTSKISDRLAPAAQDLLLSGAPGVDEEDYLEVPNITSAKEAAEEAAAKVALKDALEGSKEDDSKIPNVAPEAQANREDAGALNTEPEDGFLCFFVTVLALFGITGVGLIALLRCCYKRLRKMSSSEVLKGELK